MANAPWVSNVCFRVSYPAQQRQVVVVCVKDPYGDVAHGQLFGELKAQTYLFEREPFKSR